MKCSKCGAEIPEGDVFCPKCDEPIGKPECVCAPSQEDVDTSNDTAEEIIFPQAVSLEGQDPDKPQELGFEPDDTLQEIVDRAQEEDQQTSMPTQIEEADRQANDKPRRTHKATWLIAALLVGAAIAAGIYFLQSQGPSQTTTGGTTDNQTAASYTTGRTIHTRILPDEQPLALFHNAAYTINDYSAVAPMIKSESAYVGPDNYAQISGETVYISTEIQGIDPMSQYPSSMNTLYSIKKGEKEPRVLDTDVQTIQCFSDQEVYYSKYENGQIVQYRYAKGEIVPVTELIGTDMALVTDCSKDGSVFGFLGLVKGESDPSKLVIENEDNFVPKNGYSVNGTIHFYEKPTSNTHGISDDGKKIYVTDVPPNSRTAHLMVVADVSTGELKTIAEQVSEVILYSDSGSALCIGNVTLSDDVMNPVGDLIYYNGADDTAYTAASDAVSLIESTPKGYAWFNENSNEMLATELTKLISIPHAAMEGQLHYINQEGSLCAADAQGSITVLQESFYQPEIYSYASGMMYPTHKGDSFYWAMGDKVYRYVIGSRQQPQSITLDAPIDEKIDEIRHMGYLLDGTGAVLEQTGNTLNRKTFDGSSSSVYDSPNPITVVGLNPQGDAVYFISSDNSLYEKAILSSSNPKKLADHVQKAVAVSDGIYALCDYGESGGTLNRIEYGTAKPQAIAEGVTTLSDTVIP